MRNVQNNLLSTYRQTLTSPTQQWVTASTSSISLFQGNFCGLLMLVLSCPLWTGVGIDASPLFYLNDAKIQSVSSAKLEVVAQPLHSAGDNSNGTARSGSLHWIQVYLLHPWCWTATQYHPNEHPFKQHGWFTQIYTIYLFTKLQVLSFLTICSCNCILANTCKEVFQTYRFKFSTF